jgi:hypothetical protein
LLSLVTVQDNAWHYSLHFFSLFHFFQQLTSKHSHFFHFLYHINNFFITIQIKNSLKYNFFFIFLYKFLLLYITSSFLINFKINNSITYFCQTTPLLSEICISISPPRKQQPFLFYRDMMNLSLQQSMSSQQ